MKLKELIEELEEMKLLCGTMEVHIDYLVDNNKIVEAQEYAKGLKVLKNRIHELEESEIQVL